MRNPAAAATGGWTRRIVASSGPTAIALTGHVAILLALSFVGRSDVIVSELPAAIMVEIVMAPPSRSAASLSAQDATVEPVPPAPAEPSGDDVVDAPPEQQELPARPVTTASSNIVPAASPKRATSRAVAARNPPSAKRRASLVMGPIAEATGASDGPAGGSAGREGTSVSLADVPSIWKTRLLSHLERFKRYPDAARAQRAQGTALLSFGMDRNGHVLGYWLVRSSGYPELDDEVLARIERASPLPPAPPELGTEVVQLVVPVRFRM